MTPESRKIFLIWLLISILVASAISILMNGSEAFIENFPLYFVPLAIGSLAGLLVAQGKQISLVRGASKGFAAGLILVGIISFALAANFVGAGP